MNVSNLTALQLALVEKIAQSDYHDDPAGPVWTNTITESLSDNSVFGSLLQKGLVGSQGRGQDATCWLSAEGVLIWTEIVAARRASLAAIGIVVGAKIRRKDDGLDLVIHEITDSGCVLCKIPSGWAYLRAGEFDVLEDGPAVGSTARWGEGDGCLVKVIGETVGGMVRVELFNKNGGSQGTTRAPVSQLKGIVPPQSPETPCDVDGNPLTAESLADKWAKEDGVAPVVHLDLHGDPAMFKSEDKVWIRSANGAAEPGVVIVPADENGIVTVRGWVRNHEVPTAQVSKRANLGDLDHSAREALAKLYENRVREDIGNIPENPLVHEAINILERVLGLPLTPAR